ncbi:related to TOB3 (member of AAA-ATPase family) [Cephalotrichum gorgonifer]|uniref:Related to TOB3 (Member of AAA-ATPase family) n=1 Tax=Cephalotrichum gorgonifer TaxID=2041049 RepID=A0AAE8N2I5_9PEZI|nr:related to TOB3 (member of AAA-ATPase family) [Cephalotrichum gorgonifer]
MKKLGRAKDDVSELVWKWRCKVLPPKDGFDRTLKEIESSDYDTTEKPAPKPKARVPEPAGPAMQVKVTHWYEGRDSDPSSDRYDWQLYPPKTMSAASVKTIEDTSIAVYKIKDKDKPAVGNRFPLKTHKIHIFNRELLEAIAPILKKHDLHVNVSTSHIFMAPFEPLYFSMSEFIGLRKATPDNTSLKRVLELLLKVLDEAFSSRRTEVKSLRAQKLINFANAWTFFPADTVLYTYGRNAESLSKVVSCSYSIMSINLMVKVLIFDGTGFVWRKTSLKIPNFKGNVPITELSHYPLEFHEDPEGLKKTLTSRGRKVLDFQGLCYQTYNGVAVGIKADQHNVEGRILIDVAGYNKYELSQGKREADDPETKKNAATKRVEIQETTNDKNKSAVRRLSEEEQLEIKNEMLEKEHLLMFIGPLIEGYALKNKLWLSFYVEDILPMVWNDTAFDHLVYDEQQKDLVMSFVEHHGKKQDSFDDVIVGKGQGLVMLLSGPPGTGKTLTAEAVADRTHRPLFYLQAEDLGVSAATLGANLKRLFSMAIDWNAVVLLDEADVFMAERNPNDIMRNELVSIFLRELEYFRGIVFLTTNLYHTIDSAFRSRVNLHLLFKPLTTEARRLVWAKFLGRLPSAGGEGGDDDDAAMKVDIADEEMGELALWRMNGREIKNSVKMAQLWCDFKGYTITLEKLESAIKSTSPHVTKEGEHDQSLYD